VTTYSDRNWSKFKTKSGDSNTEYNLNEIIQQTSGEMENAGKNQGNDFLCCGKYVRNSTKTSDESEQNWLQEWR